jgi:hypothetical protein
MALALARAPAFEVFGDFDGKDPERATYEARDPVGMAAGTSTFNLDEPSLKISQPVGASLSQLLHFVGDGRKSEEAGAALTRRLARQIAGEPGGLSHTACIGREGHD